jgi:hypothetical protein
LRYPGRGEAGNELKLRECQLRPTAWMVADLLLNFSKGCSGVYCHGENAKY